MPSTLKILFDLCRTNWISFVGIQTGFASYFFHFTRPFFILQDRNLSNSLNFEIDFKLWFFFVFNLFKTFSQQFSDAFWSSTFQCIGLLLPITFEYNLRRKSKRGELLWRETSSAKIAILCLVRGLIDPIDCVLIRFPLNFRSVTSSSWKDRRWICLRLDLDHMDWLA